MASFPELHVRRLLVELAGGEVRFVVVGGAAVALQGYVRATKDLDILPATNRDNLAALGRVLVGLNARLHGVHDDVPFVADEDTLRRTQILTLDTDLGRVDVLVEPSGAAPYGDVEERATPVDVDGRRVLVASVDDLLAMKRAAGRPQDLVDVEALEMIRRMRRVDA